MVEGSNSLRVCSWVIYLALDPSYYFLFFPYLPWWELLHHVFPSIIKNEANISLFFTPAMACVASATSPHHYGIRLCHGPGINRGKDNRLEFEISCSSIIAVRYLVMVIIKLTLLITCSPEY